MNEDHELFDLALELVKIWVDCTKTKEIHKSLSVAQHPDSYRIIKSQKQALKYATKYITKPGGNWTEESIGRSWGKIGKFDIAVPETRKMTQAEMVYVRRILRKIAPKNHFIQKSLKQSETPTFVIVKENTVNRIIEYTQQQLGNESHNYSEAKGGQN